MTKRSRYWLVCRATVARLIGFHGEKMKKDGVGVKRWMTGVPNRYVTTM